MRIYRLKCESCNDVCQLTGCLEELGDGVYHCIAYCPSCKTPYRTSVSREWGICIIEKGDENLRAVANPEKCIDRKLYKPLKEKPTYAETYGGKTHLRPYERNIREKTEAVICPVCKHHGLVIFDIDFKILQEKARTLQFPCPSCKKMPMEFVEKVRYRE